MFKKARTLQELNEMKLKEEAKIVRNKKQLSAREIGARRAAVSKNFQARAKDIFTCSIPTQ